MTTFSPAAWITQYWSLLSGSKHHEQRLPLKLTRRHVSGPIDNCPSIPKVRPNQMANYRSSNNAILNWSLMNYQFIDKRGIQDRKIQHTSLGDRPFRDWGSFHQVIYILLLRFFNIWRNMSLLYLCIPVLLEQHNPQIYSWTLKLNIRIKIRPSPKKKFQSFHQLNLILYQKLPKFDTATGCGPLTIKCPE